MPADRGHLNGACVTRTRDPIITKNELTADPKAISCRLDAGLTYCAFYSYWASATWIVSHPPPSIHTMSGGGGGPFEYSPKSGSPHY
jgi:hypothetical protein